MREKSVQEQAAADRQVELLTRALSGAQGANGYWLNPSGRTLPKIYDKGPAVSAFNAFVLGLHADANGYKTAHYTTFNEARNRGESILQGEKGVPFFWYRWDKYVNRHNPEDVITKQDYNELEPDKRSLYKGLRQREVRTIFNVEQTSLPMVNAAKFQQLKEQYGGSNERGNLKAEERQLHTTVKQFADQMRTYMMPIRKDAVGVAHYNSDKDAIYLPEQKHFHHYEDYVQELMRQVVSATGHQQRLAREGMVMTGGRAPSEDAVKYEKLVAELASGVKMMELGLPAKIAPENLELVEYWKRELQENPCLIDAIESDVNNAIDVIRKAEKGEKVAYASDRNEAMTAELNSEWNEQGNHNIADVIKGLPNADTREMVVVGAQDKSVVDVILPAGARATKNELPGFEKAVIAEAMQHQGYEKVRFYNKDGAAGYRPDDGYFDNKEVVVAKLNGERLSVVSRLDVAEAVKHANDVPFDRVQMLRDDNNRWALYIKPQNESAISIYPDKEDLNRFFSTMKQGEMQSSQAIRMELAQKYYDLAKSNPSLTFDLMGKPAEDVDMSRIERVSLYKTKDGEQSKYMCAVHIKDMEAVKPREITPLQWQRIWVTDDANTYKRNLAATLFSDVLKQEQGMKDEFPNIKQYDELKAKHPDALILMRRNDNYESIRADADKVSEICGIETFERVKSDTNESVKMTSFAAPALDTFLPKLIRAGQRVAICEALEEPRKEIQREAEQTERKTGMRI
jgi:antirestriction protein ArdC